MAPYDYEADIEAYSYRTFGSIFRSTLYVVISLFLIWCAVVVITTLTYLVLVDAFSGGRG